ncbi:hypothetical protein [Chamaesiphon sp. OTE_75_metabat_556]|jgi:hypothetical protein|uniref:hypothetical protein n=1 Tax=Chamaesiphon sp. OTE_75_metabat_556 TaxID=2964692 RepID=UPI00286B7471|nr:hypothetical protein [Chamaesiphon sp. OTE_75_metabat_556]
MLGELKSFRHNPLRWLKRRYLRWVALSYWSYRWLFSRRQERQFAQVQIWRVVAGFDFAAWLLAMEDSVKPEYWGMM